MEELIENFENAKESNVQADFKFMDFSNFGNLTDGFSEDDKVEVIKQFAKEEGYIKIKGDTVKLAVLKKAYVKREEGYTDGMQSSNRKCSNF